MEIEREMTVCFTGHRNIPGEDRTALIERTDRTLRALGSRGYRTFISGGAVGFDQLAACRVVLLRSYYPDAKLVLALPCRNQTERWTRIEDLKLYKYLLGAANDVVYLSEWYDDGCMRRRNQYMVDHASLCVAYCTKSRGGTAMTLGMARTAGLGIINLAEDRPLAEAFPL